MALRNSKFLGIFFILILPARAFSLSTEDAAPQALKTYADLTRYENPTSAQSDELLLILQDHFSFDDFFSRCATDISASLTNEQSTELKRVFHELFFANLKKKSRALAARRILNPRHEQKNLPDGRVMVTLSGHPPPKNPGDPESPSYDLSFLLVVGKSRWLVADITVDGAELSRQYRGSFNKIFRERGYSGLVQSLQAKLDKLLP